ncbi:MAG: hypothetical protein WC758_00340 [Candidatus Woesearchaeota archaeon]|jgi:hypothetical protein
MAEEKPNGQKVYESIINDRKKYGLMVDSFEHNAELAKKTADEKVLKGKDGMIHWEYLNSAKMKTDEFQVKYVDTWGDELLKSIEQELKIDLKKMDNTQKVRILEAFTGHNKATMLEYVQAYGENFKTDTYKQLHLNKHKQQLDAKLKKEASMHLKNSKDVGDVLKHLGIDKKFNQSLLSQPNAREHYFNSISDMVYHAHENSGQVSDSYILEDKQLSPLYVQPKKPA